MRTADSIEAQASEESAKPAKGKGRNPRSLANLRMWKPGQSGNPSGRPKNDMAAEIAKALFSNNQERYYAAFDKALAKGNAYAFQVLADRAFGKLKETREVTHRYEEVPDQDVQKRIDDIMKELGLPAQVDAASEIAQEVISESAAK